jgi:hypothetical protein
MVAQVRTIDFLPEIFKTTPNENFLSATLDQLVQQQDLEKLQGYIGRRFEYGLTPNSYYIPEINKTRTDYQLEPAVIFKKNETNRALDFITYPEMIDALKLQGAPVTNNSLLFNNQFYSWDSFADLDKLSNYSQYYWLPFGPDVINIEPLPINLTSFFDVKSQTNEFLFIQDNFSIEEFNPTITLLRGGTYYFNVDQNSKFWIQTAPGLSGVLPNRPNVSTRDIFGLENNGTSEGVMIFNVPYADAQQSQNYTGNVNVDLVTTQFFYNIHGQRLSQIGNIDGATNLLDKTLMFYGAPPLQITAVDTFYDNGGFDAVSTNPVGFDSASFVNVSQYFFKITYEETDEPGDPIINLTPLNVIPTNTNITVLIGNQYIFKKFVRLQTGEIQIIPEVTAPLDTLYYQDSENLKKIGVIKIVDSNEANYINVETDILNKLTYISPNNVKFTNGLKISFSGDVVPEKYKTDQYYVEGVGTGIKLISASTLVTPESYSQSVYNPYDAAPYDIAPYSDIVESPITQDYITINRAAQNLNAWTRGNRWFHSQVIQETIKHTNSKNLLNVINSNEARAKRPIIEFYPNLKLFNLGIQAKPPVDYFDITATDAFTQVASQLQYYPDGLSFGLFDGCKVIFSADTDVNVRNKIYRVNYISTSVATQTSTVISSTSASTDRLTVTDSTSFVVGSLVSLNQNIGNLTAFTKYYVYDIPNSTSLRLSTDPNLSNFIQLDNATGNVVITQSPPVITLTKIANGDVESFDQTVVLLGEDRKGYTYWFNGSTWIQGQLKTTVNQPPLFDIFDSNGLSFGDTDYYNSSSFIGTSLFQYATGTGNNDPILGFPLKYSSVNNIGDIQFNVSYNTDKFNYVLNGIQTTQDVNTGYIYNYQSKTDYVRELGWQTAISNSIQYQAFNFNYDPAKGSPIFICDVPAKSTDSTAWPVVQVYVRDNILFDTEFTFAVQGNTTTITLNSTPILETPIQILIYSDKVSTTGYFTIPTNLENNIFNAQIVSPNLGDIKNHYLSICTNSKRIVGQIFGANNYRDLPNLVRYGTKIIQNSAPLSLTGAFLKNANFNLIDSLNFNSVEYIKYKSLLIDVVSKTPYESYQIASTILDNAINEITSYKTQSNSFFWSDMLPSKGAYITNRYSFNADVNQSQFSLSKIYDFTSANYNSVLLYLLRNVNGVLVQRQLIRDVDYIVSSDQPLVNVYTDLVIGDVIVVNEYNQTYGSYVPNTPTKLGFYPATIPEVVYDTSYVNPTWFIKGHDGSLTTLYGEYKNGYLTDYRDQVIFEFECRIYNNLKVSSKIPISSDEVLPGQFRNTDYNYDEILQLYSMSFLNWVGQNRIDYKSQYYSATDAYTYNYYQATNRLDNTLVKRGNWKGLYNWFFDTVTPNLTPWEMIGYTNKPKWWDSYYGLPPYTKNNLVLWTDMENGYDYNDGNPIIIESRKRPGLLKVLPVDDLGNLVDPLNSVIGNYDNLTFQTQWKVGDWGPAEFSYLKSSSWPYDLVKILALCKPAKFYALGENLDTYKFNDEFDQYLVNNKFRFQTTGSVLYGSGTAQHSYINWIVDYVQSTGNSGYDILTEYLNNLDVRLVYRLAGFSDKELLKFYVDKGSPTSRNNSLLIPDESYQVLLHENQPFDTIVYSSIIIQKTDTGYQVYGNSQNKIYFKTFAPLVNGKYETITSGSLSVRISKNSSGKVVIVPYSTEFSTPQALAEFINSYGNYLSSQGLEFNQVENNLILNWNQMIQEVLAWIQAGWETGSILNINPLAKKIVINKENAIVQPLTLQAQNYVLNQNLIPIQIKDMSIIRNGVEFSAIPIKVDDTIAYFNANLSNIEHAIVFDNVTLFNDLIYDPNTGLRQYRMLLKGAKTATWDGTVDTKGFILNQDNVIDWQANTKYTKGVIVKYKNNYYASNEIIQPAASFQQNLWTKVDYDLIQKGLLPNASSRAYESTLYYNSYQANLENDADLLSFSLIGYRPRDYLAAANLDDISQVNLYKTMIVEKGSKQATSAIQNITLQTGGINYTTYENWAINIGNYGGVLDQNFIEFKLDQQKLNGNPAIVSIIKDVNEPGSMQEIPIYALSNYGRVPNNINILPLLPSGTFNQLPSAGYVNFEDIKTYSFKVANLNQNEVSIYDIYKNEYIWIADFKGDWRIYATTSLNANIPVAIINVVNNLNDTCTVFFDKPHNLAVNTVIMILNYSSFVDGFYIIVRISDANSVVIDLSLPLSISNIESTGIVAKLQNQRVSSPKDISNLNLIDTEFVLSTVWVDENINGTWAVYRKGINYQLSSSFNKPVPTSSFGSSVAFDAKLGYFLGDSGTGNVYRYKYESNINFWNLDETITIPSSPTGFGSSMDKKQNFLAILKSATTSIVYIYELVSTEKIEAVALQNSFNISGSGAADKVVMSDDCNYFFVGRGSTRQVFVYRKNSNLTFTSIGYPLTSAISVNGNQFRVSGDRRSLLLEGQMVSFSNVNGSTTYKIITGEFDAGSNLTTFTIEGYFFAGANIGTTVYRAYYDYTNVATITGAGSATNFGSNISTNYNGTQLFISAPNQDFNAVTDTGVVYIYNRVKQIFESRFTPIQTIATSFALAWTPTNSISVFLNGNILSSSNYTLSTNILTIKEQIVLKAGDLILVEGNDFILSQTLIGHSEVTNPRVGILYGKGLSNNNLGNELLVGSPFDIVDATGTEGTVYRYTNAGKKFGIITGSSVYNLSSQINILINGFAVTLPATGINNAVIAINEANIPNVIASKTNDNKLVIQLINQSLNVLEDKLNLTVFAEANFASLGITFYKKTQTLHDPNIQNNTQYGTSIKFNELNSFVVSAPTSNRYTQTTFDFTDDEDYSNDTIFDNNFTVFTDVVADAGSAYVYDYLGAYNESIDNIGKFVLGQLVNDTTTTLGSAPYYGTNISFNNYNIIIGSPTYLSGSQNGRVNIFRNTSGKPNWYIYRNPTNTVDINKLHGVSIYNNLNNLNIVSLDYIDPLQGKLLGVVAQNLDYISSVDPAGYNNNNVRKSVWGQEYVGKLWFDTSETKFIDYHQNNILYNSRYWGTVFPGSTVSVYTWIESDVLPIDYTGVGTVYDIDAYTTLNEIVESGTIVTRYYYWVKNIGTVLSNAKTLADNIVSSYISNPITSGIAFLAPLKQNVYALYNVFEYISATFTSLHLGYKTDSGNDVAHTEFKLIRDGYAEDFLPGLPTLYNNLVTPNGLYQKLLDSFSGVDLLGQSVPNPFLPRLLQTGTNLRPSQSFFYNRLRALENYVQFANNVMIKFPITELKNPSFLTLGGVATTGLNAPAFFTLSGDDFDTNNYWEYVNWWAEGYSDSTRTDIDVPKYYDLEKLNAFENMIVGVNANSNGKREVYLYQNNNWNRIGLELGTIAIKKSLYDYSINGIGFGDSFYDSTPYDSFPSVETYNIIRGLNEEVFTDDLLIYRNQGLILLFQYIITETEEFGNYLPWLNKTSFLDVEHTLRELEQTKNFQRDNEDFLYGYINEVKPYRVKLKEFSLKYTKTNLYDGDISDFDLPAQWNATLDSFITPELVFSDTLLESQYNSSDKIWQEPQYNQWFNNYGVKLQGKENYFIGLLREYVPVATKIIVVDNAFGYPTVGVIKIDNEYIGYNTVDRDLGILSGLTRGALDTEVVDHFPGTKIFIDLPAVSVIYGGRGYTEPPNIVSYVNTEVFPAPKVQASLKAQMSAGEVVAVTVLNSGEGYKVLPELIIEPSIEHKFNTSDINYTNYTINVPFKLFETGDLLKYSKGSNLSTILGLIDNQYYYIRLIEYGTKKPAVTIANQNRPTAIAFYISKINALTDTHRLILVQGRTPSNNHVLTLGARLAPISSNAPTRQITPVLKFDRTSYRPEVTVWEPNQFYISTYNSIGNDASYASKLATAIPFPSVSGNVSPAGGSGALFDVYAWIYGNQDEPPDFYSTANNVGVYTAILNSGGLNYQAGNVITIPGNLLGGTAPTNSCTITVVSVTLAGSITQFIVEGVAKPVFLSSLQGATVPISAVTTESGTNNVIVTFNYTNTSLAAGYLNKTKLYFYKVARLTTPYIYDNSGSGGAIIWVTSPRIYGTTVSNEYDIDIKDFGNIYTTGDVITISGALLGGSSPANDLIITVTFALSGAIVFYSLSGICSNAFDEYYTIPISATKCRLFYDATLINPVKNTGATPFIFTAGDIGFYPEPFTIPAASLVTYNNKLYKCIVANSDATFDFTKWELLQSDYPFINALDRIIAYYQPTINMPGKHLPLLMTGLEYPNGTNLGNKFNDDFELDVILQGQPFYPKEIDIKSIVYDGAKYVAIGNAATNATVLYSIDGRNWTFKKISDTPINVTRIIYSGSFYVISALNASAPLLISYDGFNWVSVGSYTVYDDAPFDVAGFDTLSVETPNDELYDVVYYNNNYVAVGNNVLSSINATSWGTGYSFGSRLPNVLKSVAYIPGADATSFEGFIAVGNGTSIIEGPDTPSPVFADQARVVISYDGITWTNTNQTFDVNFNTVFGSNTKIIAAGDFGKIYWSTNASNWNVATILGPSFNQQINHGIYALNTYIVICNNGYILYSSDGETWSQTSQISSNNLNEIEFDGNYLIAVGENSTILRSSNVIDWENISFLTANEPEYNIKGETFLSGYGPEEMVPALITDNLQLTVKTTPGSLWDPTVYENFGFYVNSGIFDLGNSTAFSFANLSPYATQIAVYIISNTNNRATRIYTVNQVPTPTSLVKIQSIDWVFKVVTLTSPLSPTEKIYFEVYSLGGGNQEVKGTSDNVPVKFDAKKNVSYIDTNYPYKDGVYLFPVVYINGVKKINNVDYKIEPNKSNAITIVFTSIINLATQYVSFAIYGPANTIYQYCMPETQVFQYVSGPKTFTLTNNMGGNNPNNAVVEIDGIRARNTIDYTIVGTTLTVIPSIAANTIVSVTSFNDTQNQFFVTQTSTSIRVTPIYYINTPATPVVVTTATNAFFVNQDQVLIDGVQNITEINNNIFYVRVLPTYVENAVTYYRYELYSDFNLSVPVIGNTYGTFYSNGVGSGGFIWKYTNTISINQPTLDIIDTNRLFVHINGTRVTPNNLRINQPNNRLSIMSPIALGNTIIVTSYMPSPTPNELWYTLTVNKNNEMVIANSNIENRTWLVRPIYPTDTKIYVDDVTKLVDITSTVSYASYDITTQKIYSYLNYNIVDIVLLTVNNLVTGLELAKTSYYLNTVNSTTQVIFTSGVTDGDALEFVLRFGNTIIINGEKIRFKNINIEDNTITNFVRGAEGTAILPTQDKYSYVLSFSTKDILDPFYYNKIWNSDDYSANGDPLQISNTIPANFLKSD